MSNTRDMVQSAYNQSASSFEKNFQAAMQEKVASAIETRREEVASSVGQSGSEEQE